MLRDGRGTITSFDVPGARGTEGPDINDRGQIVGTYSEDTPIVKRPARDRARYLLDRGEAHAGSTFPRASGDRRPLGVNNRGQVVGQYADAAGNVSTASCGTRVGSPPSTSPARRRRRLPTSTIAARSSAHHRRSPGAQPAVRGFLLSGGVYTTFDAPGVPVTVPNGINNRGQIVGFTSERRSPGPAVHGFLLATRALEGPFTPIDFPGAPRTAAFGINDRGQIVGAYENPDAAPDGQPRPHADADADDDDEDDAGPLDG